jgi:hypothetical protein
MSHNTIGHLFRVTTWGESHGAAIGCVIDGCPPGIPLTADEIQAFLDKRRPGQSRFTTQRREPDEVRIVSGVFTDDAGDYFRHYFDADTDYQDADCLVAVVCQRLRFRPDLNIRLPECEILMLSHAVKNFIRNREFFKITSSLETGSDHGMWTFQRYRGWLETRKNWFIPGQTPEPPEGEPVEDAGSVAGLAPMAPAPKPSAPETSPRLGLKLPGRPAGGRIEIEPTESEFGKILKRPGE